MKYLELKMKAVHMELDVITAELMEMGIVSTEIRDNAVVDVLMDKQKSYDWDYVDPSLVDLDRNEMPELRVYFEDTEEGRKQLAEVEQKFAGHDMEVCSVDDDWVNSYKEHFKAHKMTDHIVVKPSWEELQPEPGMKVLELDPGMAFGTGDHETTGMCARLMDKYGCAGKSVLDVGTGSGILAIAAALMGASDVLGIDIDPVAVKIARENTANNGCGDVVKIIEGDLTKGVDFKADIVVANLMAEMVCMLTEHIRKHLKPGGVYISSGILCEKKQMVIDAIEREGMKVTDVMDEGEWSAIAAEL
ncbi:MAG: 50S ribosomal protein L11 methyltransferase [Anaerovoracaceae bacterium]